MTPDALRHLHRIFDAHGEALAAIRATNTQIGIANAAFGEMVAAHGEAIASALAANQAAIDLLNALNEEKGSSA